MGSVKMLWWAWRIPIIIVCHGMFLWKAWCLLGWVNGCSVPRFQSDDHSCTRVWSHSPRSSQAGPKRSIHLPSHTVINVLQKDALEACKRLVEEGGEQKHSPSAFMFIDHAEGEINN